MKPGDAVLGNGNRRAELNLELLLALVLTEQNVLTEEGILPRGWESFLQRHWLLAPRDQRIFVRNT